MTRSREEDPRTVVRRWFAAEAANAPIVFLAVKKRSDSAYGRGRQKESGLYPTAGETGVVIAQAPILEVTESWGAFWGNSLIAGAGGSG